jgi:transglutaminase-like putative cysteine protease
VLPPIARAPGLGAPDPDAPAPLEIEERITVDQLEGRLMPAVSEPSRVDGVRVAFDQSSGTLLHTDPLAPGLSYTVTSENPSVNVTLLPAADVPSGDAVARYLAVGDSVPDDLSHLAEQVATGAPGPYYKALALETFFKEHYRYASDAPSGHAYPNLRFFLFEPPYAGGQKGTSEQFATGFATLARLMGLPSRVVVGFLGPSKRFAGNYRYTSDDLHSWPEIFFTGIGWVRFEPTPSARTGTPPAWARTKVARGPTLPSSTPTNAVPRPKPHTEPAPARNTETTDESNSVPWLALAGAGLLVLLVLGAPGAIRLRQRVRRLRLDPDPRADVEGLWEELAATAIDFGVTWPDGRSPRMIADAVSRSVARASVERERQPDTDAFDLLVVLIERARYQERFTLDPDDRSAAVDAVRRWSARMASTVSPGRVRLARIAPRSLFSAPAVQTSADARTGNELTGVGQ